MDHPYYTVTVASMTRGWTYTMVEGEDWDPLDDVVLISPLTYTWGFKNERIPGHLEPFAADVNLVARTADLVPSIEVGDLITIDVRVGTAGQRIIAPPPMRVVSAEVDLTAGDQYKTRLAIGLTDLSVDWRGKQPAITGFGFVGIGTPYPTHIQSRVTWLERMAEYGSQMGISIARPTSWSGTEGPPAPGGLSHSSQFFDQIKFPGNAEDELEALINSHLPLANTAATGDAPISYTWVTVYSPSTYPPDYQWCAPSAWTYTTGPNVDYPLTDPGSALKILPVPASRQADSDPTTGQGLPLQLAQYGGQLVLWPKTLTAGGVTLVGIGHTALGLKADWCILPTQARRARDGAVNYVNVSGTTVPADPSLTEHGFPIYPYSTVWRQDAADVAARGMTSIDVPTKLMVSWAQRWDASYWEHVGVRPVADAHLSDASADQTHWSYDGFELRSSLIPQTVAAWLLSLIAPRLPGETNGDNRVLRHVTIDGIEPDLRFNLEPVSGFLSGGQMQITGGDIVWHLNMTPGAPRWPRVGFPEVLTLPAPLTVAEIVTAAGGGYAWEVLADTPGLYWRLGESSGGPMDSSGNGINGIYYSPLGSTASGPYAPERNVTGLLTGDADGAVRINNGDTAAISAYVSTGWPNPAVTQVTLEGWVKPGPMPGGGNDRVIALLGASRSVFTAVLYLAAGTTTLRFAVRAGGIQYTATGAALTVGATYHVVGTYDGTTSRLYANGVQVATATPSGVLNSPPGGFSAAAQGGGPYYFNGTLDEVAYYPTALSAARVAAHYTAGPGLTVGDTDPAILISDLAYVDH